MRKFGFYMLLAVMVAGGALSARADAGDTDAPITPQPMLYAGKPIDPLCFNKFPMDSARHDFVVDLKTCATPTEYEKAEGGMQTDPDGGIGYDFVEGMGYFYYRNLGSLPSGENVIFTSSSGGGTGQFTQIFTVRLDGAKLVYGRDIAGGDRCNGGLFDAELKDGKVNYTASITAQDFSSIAHQQGVLKAEYDKDLEGCAICCAATAEFMDGDLSAINLDDLEDEGSGSQFDHPQGHQQCFTQFFLGLKAAGTTKIEQARIKPVLADFVKNCGLE